MLSYLSPALIQMTLGLSSSHNHDATLRETLQFTYFVLDLYKNTPRKWSASQINNLSRYAI